MSSLKSSKNVLLEHQVRFCFDIWKHIIGVSCYNCCIHFFLYRWKTKWMWIKWRSALDLLYDYMELNTGVQNHPVIIHSEICEMIIANHCYNNGVVQNVV